MSNIIDFAKNYCQSSFLHKPFCTPDSLILSQISYYNYAGSSFEKIPFEMTLRQFFQRNENVIPPGMMTEEEDKKLIDVLRLGGRHGNLRACGYMEIMDIEGGEQFSAITFEILEGVYHIAFRGTDNTVVGWKEDFGLSYQEEIPAQKTALLYAKDMMSKLPGRFYFGGHSKGGNLAVYAAMHLPEEYIGRLIGIYNHDGPGFFKGVYKSEKYNRIRPLIHKTIPESSVVGLLLEEDTNHTVIRSSASAVLQHNPYSWEIFGDGFIEVEEINNFSRYIKRVLDRWIEEFTMKEREQIVETVFDTAEDTGIKWFYELTEEPVQKVQLLLESISESESEERELMRSAVKRFLRILVEEFPQAAREKSEDTIGKYLQKLKEDTVEKRLQKLKEDAVEKRFQKLKEDAVENHLQKLKEDTVEKYLQKLKDRLG